MKLLMSDIDGTISFGDNLLSQEIIEAVENFKKENKDNLFVLATGRNIEALNFLKDYEKLNADYYILCNGAAILDKNLNVLYLDKLEHNIKEICDILNLKFRIDTIDTIYFSNTYDFSSNFPVKVVNNIKSHEEIKDEILVVNGRMDNIVMLEDAISKLQKLNVQVNRNNNDLDIQKLGVNKKTGIKNLLEIRQLDSYKVYAIGDSFNDIEMLSYAELSATFTDAKDEIKDVSDLVVKDFTQFMKVVIDE